MIHRQIIRKTIRILYLFLTKMNIPLAKSYEECFALISRGKVNEEIHCYIDATQCYMAACEIMQYIIHTERDGDKRLLMIEQLRVYEAKVIENKEKQDFILSQLLRTQEAQAEQLFARAVRLDETGLSSKTVEDAYLSAVQIYMEMIKLSPNPHWRRRVALILDRTEDLRCSQRKPSQPEINLEDEFDNPLPTAPTEPIRAVPKKSPQTSNDSFSSKVITSNIVAPQAVPPTPTTTATTYDALTPEELNVLRDSSMINGKCFPPWIDGEDKTEKFDYPPNKPFVDPDGILQLSSSQVQKGGVYVRISQLPYLQDRNIQPVMIRQVGPANITQDLVADCSFVCSLCIASAIEAKFNRKLITSIIYPQNSNQVPIFNPSGKYIVKLYMNGIPRKVVVDDFLPISKTSGRILCSASRDISEFWISIIEKAYMKLNGGYDFPGSNSGIDLHSLTGWIPEQFFFQEDYATKKYREGGGSMAETKGVLSLDHRQSEERAWERILSAHTFGDCLITGLCIII